MTAKEWLDQPARERECRVCKHTKRFRYKMKWGRVLAICDSCYDRFKRESESCKYLEDKIEVMYRHKSEAGIIVREQGVK